MRVVATGGTIDKAYPRLVSGWAFEICDPAISRCANPDHWSLSLSYGTSQLCVQTKQSNKCKVSGRRHGATVPYKIFQTAH
eukprot:4314332-Amphidinium_carterae.1